MNNSIFKKTDLNKIKFYPSTSSCAKVAILKEIIALYNSKGGSIVWGIEKNGKELTCRGLRLDHNQKKFFEELIKQLKKIENEQGIEIFQKREEIFEDKNIVIIDINKCNKIIEFEEKVLSMDYKNMRVIEIDKLIFISHSSKDKEYGEFLTEELQNLGLKKEQIKFSSNDKYGIESGNILNKIKEYIKQDAYMIYLVSDNYFESPICLNEMGAAWILDNKYQVIGVPGFRLDSQFLKRSAVKNDEIAFNLDNKERMLKFKKMITEKFNL